MSVAKKERFVETNIKLPIKAESFPPEEITYKNTKLSLLGISNKTDLIPVNIDSKELQRAVTYGEMGQYIFSAENGDLYDVCIYIDKEKNIYIYGIRTRQQ